MTSPFSRSTSIFPYNFLNVGKAAVRIQTIRSSCSLNCSTNIQKSEQLISLMQANWECWHNHEMKTYRYFFIEMFTTYNRTILEIFRENITSKFVLPITLPWDAFLVHCQIIAAAGEAVCIVEHTPSYKTTRYNCRSIYTIFRITSTCWVCFSRIPQLIIISAFNIPKLQKNIIFIRI